jgi:2-oxoglutarate dehydrogenase complex dehydrogenase (E1) component-like enzyme
MAKPNTRDIETIKDIVDKVPRDQLDVFLQDLKEYILTCDKVAEMQKILPKGSLEYHAGIIHRINDGKNDAHVQITFNP